jgi:hypothetical protein
VIAHTTERAPLKRLPDSSSKKRKRNHSRIFTYRQKIPLDFQRVHENNAGNPAAIGCQRKHFPWSINAMRNFFTPPLFAQLVKLRYTAAQHSKWEEKK